MFYRKLYIVYSRSRIRLDRGGYQAYGRAASDYDSECGNGEQLDWSLRKEFATMSTTLMDNWRWVRNNGENNDGFEYLKN
ncbi:hypothetical protein MTP99_009452 [Tenebrio molitor]|jgi:hypothetical protein|nr:hypothetical protein MTP99_009452 [Tenebrio molitor]